LPLRELTPYSSGRWRVKARVVARESIRHFTNARGEGSLFKIDIIDKDGFEMSATFFGKQSVDRFYELLRTGQVFYFSKGSAKAANKRWDKGDVVLTFDEGAIIEIASEDSTIPGPTYNFVALEQFPTLEVNTIVDVKAVIAEVREVSNITVRATGKEKAKRELILWDSSNGGSFVEATAWDTIAQTDFQSGTVCYFRSARLGEWNERKTLSVGNIELNPVDSAAINLLQAYEQAGRPRSPNGFGRGSGMGTLQGRKESIQECREADLQLGPAQEKGQAFNTTPGAPRSVHRHTVNVTLTPIMTDRQPFYLACPELVERAPQPSGQQRDDRRPCHKKMNQEGNMWRCAGGHMCSQPTARYMCQRVRVLDHSGCFDISFFDDVGVRVFGENADNLAIAWDQPDGTRRDEILAKASWKRVQLRIRSARETWNDEDRIKVTADEAQSQDHVKDGKSMLAEIKAALGA
jgi:replication factor A1